MKNVKASLSLTNEKQTHQKNANANHFTNSGRKIAAVFSNGQDVSYAACSSRKHLTAFTANDLSRGWTTGSW